MKFEIEDIPVIKEDSFNENIFSISKTPICNKITYIYILCNPTTHKIRYVDKTVDIKNRYRIHCKAETKTQTSCWIKSLLPLKPIMQIVEEVPIGNNWIEREQFWIMFYRFLGAKLTNSTDGGEGLVGFIPSEETREKLRIAGTNRKHTDEERAKISAAHMGKKKSPEAVAKVAVALTGRKHTKEACAKMSESRKNPSEARHKQMSESRTGAKHTEESKIKIGLGNKDNVVSQETKDKISIANTGKIRTEEHREKLSIANKDKKRSDESKKRYSEAKKLYWANKKDRSLSEEHKAKIGASSKNRKQSEETIAKRVATRLFNKLNKGK